MVTQEMLELAMKKAVEVGLLPKYVGLEEYHKNWEGMREVLETVCQSCDLHKSGRTPEEAGMEEIITLPTAVINDILLSLQWYAQAKWGHNGDDESVVRRWPHDKFDYSSFPQRHEFFKSGGNVARAAIELLEKHLTMEAR